MLGKYDMMNIVINLVLELALLRRKTGGWWLKKILNFFYDCELMMRRLIGYR